ncbi:hypothetical protein SLEP1_g24564 [Rubroshorea leprosula]|uniref:Uncharacterized protein n=1 Tax=Rubroshorea leprosula TaxID=152421 RepID=A0AAV5JG23_9ROSI|nr:hypothetical protein SLEP1_g24564 [Rubroshorea leprosula]
MASRRGGSKRKQIGSSSVGGQAQEEGNKCKAMVVGVSFQFSPRDICAVLDIPEGGDDEFQDRKGSKSFVIASDLLCFDYLLNGKRVNLGRFIFWSLIKNYSSDMGLPHGALITRLVKRNNIDLESFKHGRIKAGTTLTKASFEKMQVVFRNGSWTKKGDQAMEQQDDEEEGDTYQEMVEQGEEEHGGDSPRPFQASMQRTNRETMELMISEIRRSSKAGSKFCSRLSRKTEWAAILLSRLWKWAFNDPYFWARDYKYGW